MRVSQAKELFRDHAATYFKGARVCFANQSRAVKPELGLVIITPGNVNRPNSANYNFDNEMVEGVYLSRISMRIDLFTHGMLVTDRETGIQLGYENTAVEDLLAFCDYLNSPYTVDWCHRHDISLLIDGDVADMTGIVNDTTYEFRSQVTVQLYFTHRTAEYTAVRNEESIENPESAPVFKETSTGGGTEELAQMETGYFTEVEIKEETGNE